MSFRDIGDGQSLPFGSSAQRDRGSSRKLPVGVGRRQSPSPLRGGSDHSDRRDSGPGYRRDGSSSSSHQTSASRRGREGPSPGRPSPSPIPTLSRPRGEHDAVLVQRREEDYALRVMREREGEMKDISEKMHQVNEIYRELGGIVGQQQEQIDQLEAQFGGAADATRRGLEQIERANGGSSAAARRRSEISVEDGPGEGTAGQFFLARHLRRAAEEVSSRASAVADLVRVCTGGGAAAGYVSDQDCARRKG
mmetsp:Transcript_727/g.1631  ORF Transcript_727/g.1631 Transcript_727/m.1631 type:complete len:251 (+) Transcript_727:83-835(+)